MTRQTSSRSMQATLGAGLAAVGLLLLFVNLDNVSASFRRPFSSPAESLGAAFELGLAGLRAVQTFFFDHARFWSGVYQILLSCWPLTLVFFGVALLQNAFGRRLSNSRMALRSEATGARQ